MRRNIFSLIGVIGGLLTVASILWEYARMNPAYRSLVDPWSIRGFESVHGAIAFVIGLSLAALAAAALWSRSGERTSALAIVLGTVVVASMIGFGFAPDHEFGFGTGISVAFGFLLSLISMRLVQRRLMRGLPIGTRPKTSVSFLVWAGSFVILTAILIAVSSDDLSLGFGLTVMLFFILLGTLSIATPPVELAAGRMLIYASLFAGAAIGLSGGAIRSTLIRLQSGPDSTIGFPAQYKDSQVTWGWFLANIGIALVFIGAVSLWGKRRDALQAAMRIAAQRAAAEESAAEIAEARAAAGL